MQKRIRQTGIHVLIAIGVCFAALPTLAQGGGSKPAASANPWMNASLSPDQRADMVLKQLTLDEKISLLHGTGDLDSAQLSAEGKASSNGGAGYVVGIPRLGIPGIQMADAAYGVTRSGVNGRYSTALPDDLAAASSWDTQAAYTYGALIGRELRAQGYNMTLGGGVNLAREPRDGRTFEYMGEDPILAGTMDGAVMQGMQAQHVISDIKHYAMNDQESGRTAINANIGKRAMRESDLLAFEIALHDLKSAAVMCSYNRVNGDYACENKYLLTDVLKKDWNFPGFVLSDWGGTHSTVKASAAGLDNEEPGEIFYGAALKQAVLAGKVPMSELDEHVHRILRTEFASGIVDDPPKKSVIDVAGDLAIAQHLAEQSIVLLQNKNAILPLDAAKIHSIAVIGAHADIAMLSGGGSAQVDPPGGNAVAPPGKGAAGWKKNPVWFPTSPLKALQAKAPNVKISYNPGTDPASAAASARTADVAIVFVSQWEREGMDLDSLTLPNHQDALVQQVAAANPHTIVVLETGSPAQMPWASQVSGIVEAWYPGSRGAEALANILFGDVNPSAKLPITFPLNEADLQHSGVVKPPPQSTSGYWGADADKKEAAGLPAFQVTYDEGFLVGYKWYDAKKKPVLFPFGYGLSYTTYAYSGLKVTPGKIEKIRFTVKNTGSRAGAEIAEVYAALPASAGEPPKRLVDWNKMPLQPGESRTVTIMLQPKYLSIFDEAKDGWQLVPGAYTFFVGGSSQDLPLQQTVNLK